MSDQDPSLPEDLRKALKNSAPYTPPESFYADVLRKIRTEPEPRSRWAWIMGMPMKFSVATAILMISYFAYQDKTPWGPKKSEMMVDQVSSASQARAIAQEPNAKDTSVDVPQPVPQPMQYGALAKEKVASVNGMVTANKKSLLDERKPGAEERDDKAPILAGGVTFPWQSAAQAKLAAPVSAPAQAFKSAGVDQLASTTMPMNAVQSSVNHRQLEAFNAPRSEAAQITMWKGADSHIEEFRTVLVRSSVEWNALWSQHAIGNPPVVDFDQWMVIGVFAGTRQDLLSIDIESVQTDVDTIVVSYREQGLPADAGVAPSSNRPYELQIIPKSTLSVRFNKTTR